jgi:hypothetical protein
MDEKKKQLFKYAFEYIVAKEGRCTIPTAMCCFESADITAHDKIAVGWAILSMIEKGRAEFDAIEPGLTNQMKANIVENMG